MIYASLRCVLKMSLSLIKIRSHLFGKPVLVCRTLEKASTLVQLRIRFKAQRKKKEKKIHERKHPKHVFLKINYAKIILQKVFNEIFVRIEADQHERTSCLLHKNCGKTAPTRATTNKLKAALDEIPTAKRSFAEKSKQNHRRSPIFRLTLRLFRAGKQRNRNKATHLETDFPKILTKNMFSFHLKNCFCCHDKHKLLNSNRFQFAFCA